ncbi:MAG: Riboflavin transporter [Alphaproteobacteria bacterium MarineAlpha9_Bin7]|nr:MAG: Riboflavin transporter [Alphaproteobacteria bacterium MarineAlpha9_Bin7]
MFDSYFKKINRLSGNLRGVLLMFVATICFSVMHALIRYMSAELHPFELAFFRNLFGLLVVIPWFMRYGLKPLKTKRLGLHALRAGINAMAMLMFFYAVSITPLADVAALSFTAPIFATVLAILILGEVVGFRRWCAILFGFCGTLVLLRPGLEVVSDGQLLVVASASFWACALIVIKILGRTESSVTIITYLILLMAPLSAIPAAMVWSTPSFQQLGVMAAMGVLGTFGQLLMTQALKEGDTNAVMPLDFLKMIWAVLLGFFVFGEVPGIFTWVGGAMIFASITYIAYREHKVRKISPLEAVARPTDQ